MEWKLPTLPAAGVRSGVLLYLKGSFLQQYHNISSLRWHFQRTMVTWLEFSLCYYYKKSLNWLHQKFSGYNTSHFRSMHVLFWKWSHQYEFLVIQLNKKWKLGQFTSASILKCTCEWGQEFPFSVLPFSYSMWHAYISTATAGNQS